MTDSDEEDDEEVVLFDTFINRIMSRPRGPTPGPDERLVLHMPPPQDPLSHVLHRHAVFNSLINMVYGTYNELSDELDPTEYYDYDDFPRTPVSRSWFESLPLVRDHDDSTCVVCMCSLEGTPSVRLPCGHCFHRDCIGHWFRRRSTCPVCRVECGPRHEGGGDTAPPPRYEVGASPWRRHSIIYSPAVPLLRNEPEIEQDEVIDISGLFENI